MREIKFRGKRIDNGEMVYGSLSMGGGCPPNYDKTRTFIEPNEPVLRRIEVHPGTVGEYTSLKDCKNVEIYEWDKVRGTIDGELHEWSVEWEETDDYTGWPIGNDNWPFEVIGNIHENKETNPKIGQRPESEVAE